MTVLGGGYVLSSASADDAQADSAVDARDANTRDTKWRDSYDKTAPNGADRTPHLFQMLSYNDKINTDIDEIRIDAVIRVAHGEVSTEKDGHVIQTGSWSGDTGLRFVYNFVDNQINGNGLGEVYEHGGAVKYAATADGKLGANQWAANQHEYYTIHKIVHSGLYDYVTVSFVADVNYPDDRSDGWWKDTEANGRTTDAAQVWVMVGHAAIDSANYKINGRGDLDWYQSHYGLTTNIMAGYHVQLFPYCDGSNGDWTKGCDQPNLFMSYNNQPPYLWSGNQSNWGLVSDYGLGGSFYSNLDDSRGNHDQDRKGGATHSTYSPSDHPNGTDEGVAPPNSFVLSWYDNQRNASRIDTCHRYKSYWYEWMELKDNTKWVPVTSLTGDGARLVTGAGAASERSDGGTSSAYRLDNDDPFAYNENNAGKHEDNLYYRPTEGTNQAGGPMQPAQNADGSIDFKKAKAEDPGDGYFRLVSWPNVDANGCATNADTNNPGITLDMANNHPDVAQAQMDKGWVNNTAFYKYDVSRPKVPTITSVSADNEDNSDIAFSDMASGDSQFALGDNKAIARSGASQPTIKGTGTPGQWISLYEDVPNSPGNYSDGSKKNIIVKGTTDDYENTGHLVGKARVGDDGKWSIQATDADDTVDATQPTERLRRYHAYQTDMTTQMNGMRMELSSFFSPVSLVQFKMPLDPAPSVDKVVAPYTVNGKLEGTDPQVTVSGKVYSNEGGSSMKLYAQHVDKGSAQALSSTKAGKTKTSGSVRSVAAVVRSKQATGRAAPTSNDELTVCAQTNVAKSTTDAGTGKLTGTEWTCQVPTSWFVGHTPNGKKGCEFTFTAVTANSEGDEINSEKTSAVDFYAPKAGLKTANNHGLSGVVSPTGPALKSVAAGAKITITWPEGTPAGAKTSTTADANGNWSVPLQPGTPKGKVTVQAQEVDADGTLTNQSALESMTVIPAPPLEKLPFTGNRPWGVWLLALAMIVVTVGGYELLKRYRIGLAEGRPLHAVRRGDKARHSIRRR